MYGEEKIFVLSRLEQSRLSKNLFVPAREAQKTNQPLQNRFHLYSESQFHSQQGPSFPSLSGYKESAGPKYKNIRQVLAMKQKY